jgi:hypothetical protein
MLKALPELKKRARAAALWGAAGFNITPSHLAGGLEDFVELVVPILQVRGPFRTAYAGTTLRSQLGLTWPEQRAA